jgi:carbamoyltransferase
MNYVGISCGYHDAALTVIGSTGNILFAGHAERYGDNKHTPNLNMGIIDDARKYITDEIEVHYYERPLVKYMRRLWAGERPVLSSMSAKNIIGDILIAELGVDRGCKIHTHNHHLAHAAAGFQTSPYDNATVVVIDAIGEFETITIWKAKYVEGKAKYKKLYTQNYPNSIGLFYTGITQRVGLRPLDEEYILMGMAAYGKPIYVEEMRAKLDENLHIGVGDDFLPDADHYDLAASAQVLVEELIMDIIRKAKQLGTSSNLVYGGGVALNCLANRRLGEYYKNVWILPNPGDAGSSLGAAALGYGGPIKFDNAYLGHNIPGEYPVSRLIDELITNKIVGVASGRAEFGPRALGNRSLLADPRGPEIKELVNNIKRRQQFRPFAPVILEELADSYFDMSGDGVDSRYMQRVVRCIHPELFPAIIHRDGTSRVQTVPNDGSGIRRLLEAWYKETGCPMLLNTSLNIRGEPMVNNRQDADRFEELYDIKVCS